MGFFDRPDLRTDEGRDGVVGGNLGLGARERGLGSPYLVVGNGAIGRDRGALWPAGSEEEDGENEETEEVAAHGLEVVFGHQVIDDGILLGGIVGYVVDKRFDNDRIAHIGAIRFAS